MQKKSPSTLITFEGMYRYEKIFIFKMNVQFKQESPSFIEQEIKKILIKENLEKAYLPRENFHFTFVYKIGEMKVVVVFFNGWRIFGVVDDITTEIRLMNEEEESSLKELIETWSETNN